MEKSRKDKLQEHIDKLARDLNTIVVQEPGKPGMMYVEYEPPMIEGPKLIHQKDYFVMLHELGHVFHGHTQGRPPFDDKTYYFDNGVLRSEAEAWEYALDTSLEEPTYDTRQFMWNICLGSYYLGAVHAEGKKTRLYNGNRHHVQFVFDEPDDYFWSIKERILNEN